MTSTKIKLSKRVHRNKQQIIIDFPFDEELISLVKTIPGRRWSQILKHWYVPYSESALKNVQATLKNYNVDSSDFNKRHYLDHSILPKKYKTLTTYYSKYLSGKRYSKSTIDSYLFLVTDFLTYSKSKELHELTLRQVELYIEDVFLNRKYSISTQRQLVSTLKLFKSFCPEVGYDAIELERPKKDRKLPVVLSKEEIINLIRLTKNLKHRAIIALIYSCGLRISELINLEIRHIDINRKQLHIKNAKGRKDRYVIIAESFMPLLHNYMTTYEPTRFFVEGQKGNRYSAESIRKFLKTSCQRAGIYKRVTPHTLRHSYATHLLENGIDLRYIQALLGHAKPETTMIYTHVAQKDLLAIKSPLDIAVKQFTATEHSNQKVVISGS
ncbi:site-specific tyrosine recombinase/integron integrase [Psychroserpens mesophilus]|uniref:site-specific tyrosine recombinase/integron integrase n=1 Tax=Psychroserpens mesophilus TaxID=325473 RepID=UPI00058E10A0|nr:site-specific tyrosine recombinase/integron integrase [Psychroserpens mesophilus]